MTADPQPSRPGSPGQKRKKVSAAVQAGLVARRFEFGIYANAEQAAALTEQAALVRSLRNALIAVCEERYKRKIGDASARAVMCLLSPDLIDDPAATERPRAQEMSKWITHLRDRDARWREMSCWTPLRVAKAVDQQWRTYFSNLKKHPELAGRPKPSRDRDRIWVPYIHIKRAGDIGSSGSGCELTHLGGRNWALRLQCVPGLIHARGQMPQLGNTGRFIDLDVRTVAGKWKASVCAHRRPLRLHGHMPVRIEFALIDGQILVNGRAEVIDGISRAQDLQDEADRLQSERDRRWDKATPRDPEWRKATAAIIRLRSRVARVRRNALHVWTARLVRNVSEITLTMPEIRQHTRTPRGDQKRWGAAVETVSKLNRHVLSQAPGALRQMLKYKAKEAGIECHVENDEAPDIAIGAAMVETGRAIRRATRRIKKEN